MNEAYALQRPNSTHPNAMNQNKARSEKADVVAFISTIIGRTTGDQATAI